MLRRRPKHRGHRARYLLRMITCVIRYDLDPYAGPAFERYARAWGEVIPRCGAQLVGYFAPHEGSATLAYGIYAIADLAAYEAYRARLRADPQGRENYAFAARERFIRSEDRTFLRRVDTVVAP
jgi:hypothetical protein